MDPITAFGVATNVVQFVDFTCKLIVGSYEIYKSADGTLNRHHDLSTVTKSLTRINESLIKAVRDENSKGPVDGVNANLAGLLNECHVVAEQILAKLQKLKLNINTENRKLASFKHFIRSAWTQGELDGLQQRMNDFRQQISMHLLVSVREQIFKLQERQDGIDQKMEDTAFGRSAKSLLDVLVAKDQRMQWQVSVVEAIHRSYERNMNAVAPDITQMVNQTNEGARGVVADVVLKSLQFLEINDRRQRILRTHQETFEWIFRGENEKVPAKANFKKWLRDNESIYWITGKAGSGKSTMMKFIHSHPSMDPYSGSFYGSKSTIIGAFFFWHAGTTLQVSKDGLLRTLIHDCLEKCPSLVPVVLPQRWEAVRLFDDDHQPWTWSELRSAFTRLLNSTRDSHKLLFLVDGLDEFGGDPTDLVSFIHELVEWPHVKICVASRPWVVFEDAFKRRPSLMLHHLTFDDIQRYVSDKFSQNPGFCTLQLVDPDYADNLKLSIAEKASGVFLWVYLVVRSLLDGLTSGDRISDLERRLNALPTDLEALFWKMLNSADAAHFERVSQLIQIIEALPRKPKLLEVAFADEDEDLIFRYPAKTLSDQETDARAEIMRRRLNFICKGLFDVGPQRPLASANIEYLHRTVRDFLQQSEIKSKIQSGASKDFDANAAWCRSCIMELKVTDPDQLSIHSFWRDIRTCLTFAEDARESGYAAYDSLLDEMDKAAEALASRIAVKRGRSLVDEFAPTKSQHWTTTRPDSFSSPTFLSFAVQCQLQEYVTTKLDINRTDPTDLATTLLGSALCAYSVFSEASGRSSLAHNSPSPAMVNLLLKHGADPNAQWGEVTIWACALEHAIKGNPVKYEMITCMGSRYEEIDPPVRKWNLVRSVYDEETTGSFNASKPLTGLIKSKPIVEKSSEGPPKPIRSDNSNLHVKNLTPWEEILKACLRSGADPLIAVEALENTPTSFPEVLVLAKGFTSQHENGNGGARLPRKKAFKSIKRLSRFLSHKPKD